MCSGGEDRSASAVAEADSPTPESKKTMSPRIVEDNEVEAGSLEEDSSDVGVYYVFEF